ncbi:MAG: hypothetical protein KF805_04455 [Phycisphaeraceae bacterium]|nr:hypothetical protein [Phycisphaeraceae bacterium]
MSKKARLAIATCRENDLARLADAPLVEAFHACGIEAFRVAWDDAHADWSSYDGVLIRSTWDWHLHPERFLAWLGQRAKSDRIWNPVNLVSWCLDKRSLIDLDSRGIRSVPTLAIDAIESIRTFSSPWTPWVIKPAFGATAYRTSVIQTGADLDAWRDQNRDFSGPLVAQQFQPSVLERGELSLIYIGGEYSHSVRKRAKPGDFRVQAEFGGGAERVTPDAADLDIAARCLRALGEQTVFARIDLVHDNAGLPMVIECELAEPELFFGQCPEAAMRLARAVASRVWQPN